MCPDCLGRGAAQDGTECGGCRGSGVWRITSCPRAKVRPEVVDLCRLVDLAEVALPVAGGVLDQADAFVEGMRALRACESRARAQLAERRRSHM